jgi:hypothetical protein
MFRLAALLSYVEPTVEGANWFSTDSLMQDGAIRGTLMREAERAEQYGVCDFGTERAV